MCVDTQILKLERLVAHNDMFHGFSRRSRDNGRISKVKDGFLFVVERTFLSAGLAEVSFEAVALSKISRRERDLNSLGTYVIRAPRLQHMFSIDTVKQRALAETG